MNKSKTNEGLNKIYYKLQKMNEENQNCDGDETKIQGRLDLVYKLEKKIKVECIQEARRDNIKYVVLIIVFVISSIIAFNTIPLINYLFSSQHDSIDLRNKLKDFIPSDMTIKDVVEDTQLQLLAWDVNHRSPRLFTKWAYDKIGGDDSETDSTMSLLNMTVASASTPMYFTPAEIEG